MTPYEDLARRWQQGDIRTDQLSLHEQEQVHRLVMQWALDHARAPREYLRPVPVPAVATLEDDMKLCPGCHALLPIASGFYRNRAQPLGPPPIAGPAPRRGRRPGDIGWWRDADIC